MKILDKRGRVFGRLNIVDFLLVVFIGVIFLVGVKYLFFQDERWVEVEVQVGSGTWWWIVPPPPNYLADAISVGDVERNSRGQVIAEIIDVKKYGLASQNRNMQWATTANPAAQDVFLRAKIRATGSGDRIKYKRKNVEIGAPVAIETNKALINGTVVWIEGLPEPLKVEKLVRLKLYRIHPWEADSIEVGDKMGREDEFVEVLDKSVELAEVTVSDAAGNVFAKRDPLWRDVVVDVKMGLEEYNDRLLFRREQIVKPGKKLYIEMPGYDLTEAFVLEVL